jgi:cytidine deaminase
VPPPHLGGLRKRRLMGRLLLTAHHTENHRVAAAIRGESGAVYLGLHIGAKRINVCAESSALANARMAQEASIDSVVAVSMDGQGQPQVTNPCGLCRELLRSYGTETSVLVDAEGGGKGPDQGNCCRFLGCGLRKRSGTPFRPAWRTAASSTCATAAI